MDTSTINGPFSIAIYVKLPKGNHIWHISQLTEAQIPYCRYDILIKHTPNCTRLVKHPGGLFIEPAFSTFAVFVIDFIPQITVVLHLSQSSISLKSTRVLFTGYVKNLSGTLFFSALSVLHNFCSELGEVFVGTVFPSPLPSANMRPNLAIEQD